MKEELEGRIATAQLFFADSWVEVSAIGAADSDAGDSAALAAIAGIVYTLNHIGIRAKVRYQHRKNKPDTITLKNVEAILSCGSGFSLSANAAASEVVLKLD